MTLGDNGLNKDELKERIRKHKATGTVKQQEKWKQKFKNCILSSDCDFN